MLTFFDLLSHSGFSFSVVSVKLGLTLFVLGPIKILRKYIVSVIILISTVLFLMPQLRAL